MPDIPLTVNQYQFTLADAAANTGAPAALTPVGLPDTTDVPAVPMLKLGAVVGMLLAGSPAAGDTVTAQVFKNGVAVPGAALTISNATPNAVSLFSKDVLTSQFAAGDLIGVRYTTTTAGAYTVKDIYATAAVQYGLSE